MNRGAIGPGELRPSEIIELPDGRNRVTRWLTVSEGRKAADAMFIAKGTADAKPARGRSGGSTNSVRLIDQRIDAIEGEPVHILIYEEIPATGEIQVGENTRIKLEDGREAIEANFLQFSSDAYAPGTVGTTTAPGDASAYLQKSEQSNDGTLRRIKRTYVYAGLIEQRDETRYNGKLLLRTLVWAKTEPVTPTGYTRISTSVHNPSGFPVYTYTYAKGDGEISRSVSYSESDDQGTTGATATVIRHLTASSVATDPTSAPAVGHEKVDEDKVDQDGHRIWTITYGFGTGKVAERISPGPLGLRRVTWISLGTRLAPDGIVIEDDWRLGKGYKIYTVTSMQTGAGGSDPTTATATVERYVDYQYPGRAKAFEESLNSRYMMDVYQDPPVTAKVRADVTISYQTSDELGTISDLWNPTQWACLRAQWIGFGGDPSNLVRPLPGYRSVSATALTRTASAVAPNDVSIFGNTVFGGTEAKIVVTGGPEDPGGNTYTLHAEIDPTPVFAATDGTKYYRKTVITATIPAQDALPV